MPPPQWLNNCHSGDYEECREAANATSAAPASSTTTISPAETSPANVTAPGAPTTSTSTAATPIEDGPGPVTTPASIVASQDGHPDPVPPRSAQDLGATAIVLDHGSPSTTAAPVPGAEESAALAANATETAEDHAAKLEGNRNIILSILQLF